MNLEEFAKDLLEEVLAQAEVEPDGEFQENVFTRSVLDWLVEIGECVDPDVCFYKAPGMKVNGWDLQDDNDSLDLFVTMFDGTTPLRKIPRSEVEDAFARCRKFLARSLKDLWKVLEESSPAFEVAQQIAACASTMKRVRIYLLANGLMAPEAVADERLGPVVVSHYLWDVERLYQVYGGAGGPEPIEVGEDLLGSGIPCAKMPVSNGAYSAYVGIIPGAVLSGLFERWGQRLLEKNLRSFLQVRGTVNKEIQKTLLDSPGMFLAFNNGISTTADGAEVVRNADGQYVIRSLRNFQIVNGAQTTASIYEAQSRRGADLSRVFVPIKITVLDNPADADRYIPSISKYANSQNKVNLSDFSSNHPYHVVLERLSRRIWVPNPEGRGKSTTKWYYERARGQYMSDLHAAGTPAKRSAFKVQYPPRQKLTKTLVAKYEMTWMQHPHVVSMGAEKNFKQFMASISAGERFEPDEHYFRQLVAKAILFTRCDEIVRRAGYPGYKANIVTYSVAYLSFRTEQLLNLDSIWERQDVSPTIEEALRRIASQVQSHIMAPPREGMNVGEWCKKEQCWSSLREKPVDLPALAGELVEIGRQSRSPVPTSSPGAQPTPEEAVAIEAVVAVTADVWFRLAAWGKQTGNLTGWERRFAFGIGRVLAQKRSPTKRQAPHALRILQKAREVGFSHEVMTQTQ